MSGNQKEIDNAKNELNSWQLGQTSKQYESGNNGPGTISTGKGDNGGMSYGTYQIETKQGTMKEYLKYSNNYNHQFDGLVPTTAAFNQKWKQLAASDPEFAKSQHSFIMTQHYLPQLKKLEDNGYNFLERGKAIQDMVWSTAVQYRNRTLKIIQRAEQESGLDFNTASDTEIITAVQKSKLLHVNQDFSKSSPKIKQGVKNRIPCEEKSLLQLNKYENLISEQKDNFRTEKNNSVIGQSEKVGSIKQFSAISHKLFQQYDEKFNALCEKRGITAECKDDFENLRGVAIATALTNGLPNIEKVDIDSQTRMLWLGSYNPRPQVASLSIDEAVNIPVSQSMASIHAMEQQNAQQTQEHQFVQLQQENQGRSIG